jgi:hypothetical protein
MVVQDDRMIARCGDVRRRVNVHSVSKSLLSALCGIAIPEGRISLSSTLAQPGIDDKPPGLTEVEKQATVRDLLMAGLTSITRRPTKHRTSGRTDPHAEAMQPGRFGSITTGTSMLSVRSTDRHLVEDDIGEADAMKRSHFHLDHRAGDHLIEQRHL